jgi:hypothetical protein
MLYYKMNQISDTERIEHLKALDRARQKKYYDAKKALINERKRNAYAELHGIKKPTAISVIKQAPLIEEKVPIEKKVPIENIKITKPVSKKKKEKLIMIDNEPKINEEDAINSRDNISETTKKDYLKKLRKLHTIFGAPILKLSNDTIISKLAEEIPNVASRYTYINLPIIVKNHFGFDANLLISERENLKAQRDGHTEAKKSDDTIIYYDLNCIHKDIERLAQSGDKQSYIINYLLFNYGVRNKDLDLFITNDKTAINSDDNFLLVGDKSVKWIRNNYKTKANYGTKVIIIKNANFLRVMKLMPNNSYLLSFEGTHIASSSLDKFIRTRTIHNLTESQIFKNILHEKRNSPSIDKIKKQFSEWRGTSLKEINQYYAGYGYSE